MTEQTKPEEEKPAEEDAAEEDAPVVRENPASPLPNESFLVTDPVEPTEEEKRARAKAEQDG